MNSFTKTAVAAICAVFCAALSGCANQGLDKAGKEQGQLTMSMMSELSGAATTFRDEHAKSVTYLNWAGADQRAGLARAQEVLARELAAMAAVADEQAMAVQKRLDPLVATLEQNAVTRKTVDELAAETRALLKPLPQVSQPLAEAKKAVAALVEGVPPEKRLKELKAYADIARKSLSDAKEKLHSPDPAASADGT